MTSSSARSSSPRAVVRVRRLKANRLVKALHERLGDAALGGDIFVTAIESSGRLDGGGVEERDREGFWSTRRMMVSGGNPACDHA
jgi:hypothetical protein